MSKPERIERPEAAVTNIIEMRNSTVIDHRGSLEISLSLDLDYEAIISCYECQREIIRPAERGGFWFCPICGYDATDPEVTELCNRYIESIKKLMPVKPIKPKKGFFAWLLGIFFTKRQPTQNLLTP